MSDSGEARAELNDRIGQVFLGGAFDAIRFPGGPSTCPTTWATGGRSSSCSPTTR